MTTSGEIDANSGRDASADAGMRGVSRLGAPVLRYLAEHPGQQVTGTEIGNLAAVAAEDGGRLVSWLERAGLLLRDSTGEEPLYMLADPAEQCQRRSRPLVLLVEDHASIAGMTETVLTSEGYSVVMVRNPMEAHVILRVVTFDVILTDSFSPTLDLAVRVLGPLLRRSAVTPVVLFTAHHWNPTRVQAEGFTEIITKPFEVNSFLARVEQLAAMHSAASAW